MAPSRRLSNGRSPLVNQQSQITKFFNKSTTTSTPSPSPSPSPTLAKQNPKTPITVINPQSGPTTSHQSKKPVPAVNLSTSVRSASLGYGGEVVGRRLRVYWPLDQSWYEGHVRGFDEASGKHKVHYDDGEEEEVYLGKENIDWVEEKPRSFRRLRKAAAGEVREKVEEEKEVEESGGDDDDSSDEDWGKSGVKEVSEEEEEDKSDDMVVEEEEDDEAEVLSKSSAKKRKVGVVEMSGVAKKSKSVGAAKKTSFGMGSFTGGGGGNLMEQFNKCESE